jgi:hypothetical protein
MTHSRHALVPLALTRTAGFCRAMLHQRTICSGEPKGSSQFRHFGCAANEAPVGEYGLKMAISLGSSITSRIRLVHAAQPREAVSNNEETKTST